MPKLLASGLILLALPGLAWAGGASVPIIISSFERLGPHSAWFQVTAADSQGVVMPSCPVITVHADYGPHGLREFLLSLVGLSEAPATREQQKQALDSLENAHRDRVRTRLGLMGDGLSRDHDGTCAFHSSALQIVQEYGGRYVVYSFAKWN